MKLKLLLEKIENLKSPAKEVIERRYMSEVRELQEAINNLCSTHVQLLLQMVELEQEVKYYKEENQRLEKELVLQE